MKTASKKKDQHESCLSIQETSYFSTNCFTRLDCISLSYTHQSHQKHCMRGLVHECNTKQNLNSIWSENVHTKNTTVFSTFLASPTDLESRSRSPINGGYHDTNFQTNLSLSVLLWKTAKIIFFVTAGCTPEAHKLSPLNTPADQKHSRNAQQKRIKLSPLNTHLHTQKMHQLSPINTPSHWKRFVRWSGPWIRDNGRVRVANTC